MLVYFAVMIPVLLGFCGLAVDMGRLELRQVQLQAAADAAALSSAAELQHASSTWTNAATIEVTNSATQNGFPVPTIAVQQGASFGAYATDNSVVQVTLTQTLKTTFMALVGSKSATLSVRGVAMIPPCVWLSGSPPYPGRGQAALALSSQGLTVACPIYSGTGYFVDGFSHILGQARTSGPPSSTVMAGWTYPAIKYNTPAIPDPLGYIVAPVFSSCMYTNKNYIVPTTISPGTYCGTLKATNTTLTMLPGLYIITGGVLFTGSVINGTGVTLYLTKGGGSPFGKFQLVAGSSMNLSAPLDNSAGGIPAILLFTDRSWGGSGTTAVDVTFDQSSMYGDGILYTTNTGIYDWQTQLSAPNYFTMVTACFSVQNANITPRANYSQLPGGDPLRLPISIVQ